MNTGNKKAGRVTIILDEDNEEYIRDKNRKKGDLSKIVNQALRNQRTTTKKIDEQQLTDDWKFTLSEKVMDQLGANPGDTLEYLEKDGELILRKKPEE